MERIWNKIQSASYACAEVAHLLPRIKQHQSGFPYRRSRFGLVPSALKARLIIQSSDTARNPPAQQGTSGATPGTPAEVPASTELPNLARATCLVLSLSTFSTHFA
ncbi:hypothetical protein V2G26_013933 [Clonostachys chloroleuca]